MVKMVTWTFLNSSHGNHFPVLAFLSPTASLHGGDSDLIRPLPQSTESSSPPGALSEVNSPPNPLGRSHSSLKLIYAETGLPSQLLKPVSLPGLFPQASHPWNPLQLASAQAPPEWYLYLPVACARNLGVCLSPVCIFYIQFVSKSCWWYLNTKIWPHLTTLLLLDSGGIHHRLT